MTSPTPDPQHRAEPAPLDHVSHPRAGRRLALMAGAAVLFLGVASVVKPPPRASTAAIAPLPAPSAEGLAALARGQTPGALIGTLEGAEHRVLCHASPAGPRYSVFTLDGRLLRADLPADEVYRVFPGLDLENMRLEKPDAPLMLMDHD